MKVLHLCSYYIGNKLYRNLFYEISKKRISQSVYIPIRNKMQFNKNYFNSDKTKIYYDLILKKYDRFLYGTKIVKQLRRVVEKIPNIESTSIIHAHTLFSDGGTAYLLNMKYGIKYIVSIRNTDINVFYKYALHYRFLSHKILKNASAIIFISPAYKEKTLNVLPRNIAKQISDKSFIIPNGIDNRWFKEISSKTIDPKKQLKLLFVGTLDQNKNVISVIRAVERLVSQGKDVNLNIAGDGPLLNKLISQVEDRNLQNKIVFHGQIDIEKLIEIMDTSDIFILPSYKETFGISYIEAMARGVPVIYTRGEGISGYFADGSVGYSITPDNINEMINAINDITDNYEIISRNCIIQAKNFNWDDIAQEYIDLYTLNSRS
ncbi:glycosyltransferase family 4 protein [Bhargavaea ginsengi]|uniref:glycosyltransferase family 4 protein n=1 Tax=Bhargavaea ginsengi TaxID=426757 RepID=UPI00203BE7B1|nr:glycosyltransferase family 4 protein [Bhargavaea ginsengi]MCM3088665.1 glycosyltransferase family 4 protein [Bhargavaea ginsengi]